MAGGKGKPRGSRIPWRPIVAALLLVGPAYVAVLEYQGHIGGHHPHALDQEAGVARPSSPPARDSMLRSDHDVTLDDIYVDVGAGIPQDRPGGGGAAGGASEGEHRGDRAGSEEEDADAVLSFRQRVAEEDQSRTAYFRREKRDVEVMTTARAEAEESGGGGGIGGASGGLNPAAQLLAGSMHRAKAIRGAGAHVQKGLREREAEEALVKDKAVWAARGAAVETGATHHEFKGADDPGMHVHAALHHMSVEDVLKTLKNGHTVPNMGIRSVNSMLHPLQNDDDWSMKLRESAEHFAQSGVSKGSGIIKRPQKGNHLHGALKETEIVARNLQAPYAGLDSPTGLHTQRFSEHWDEAGFRQRMRECNAALPHGKLPSLRNMPVTLAGRERHGYFHGTPGRHGVPAATWMFNKNKTDWKWKSCAVVGNAGSYFINNVGKEIDGHDMVIRFNNAPTGQDSHSTTKFYHNHRFVDLVGKKTSLRVLGRRWVAHYTNRPDSIPRSDMPLEVNATLVAAGADKAAVEALAKHMAMTRKDVKVVSISPKAWEMSEKLLHAYRSCVAASMFKRFDGGRRPSVGLAAALVFSNVCESAKLYGFGMIKEPHKWGQKQEPWNYFHVAGSPDTWRGLPNYPKHADHEYCPEAEVVLLKALALEGRLHLCDTQGCHIGRDMDRHLKFKKYEDVN